VTPVYATKLAKHVISIEPEPFCIDAIQQTITFNRLDNVTLVPAALSAENSTDLFMVGGGGSSITSLVSAKGVESVSVKCM
jgi:FkbM family methyltransferase